MQTTDESKKYVENYLQALMMTKNIRYSASCRLNRKNNLSLLTISILSIYVIIASIAPLFLDDLPQGTTNALYFFSVICSLFIIALSLLEAGKDYKTRSELLLKCARRITVLIDRIKYLTSTDALTPDAFEKIQDEYNKILSEFTVNHDEIDYLYHMAKSRSPEKKGSSFSRYNKLLKYQFNIYFYYLALLSLPLIVLLLFL